MISKQSLNILLDLVEIKISAMVVLDKDDLRELQKLKNCKKEILILIKDYVKINSIVHKQLEKSAVVGAI